MRATWKGVLSFGLVNIPVSLYNGTRERAVGFRLLHDKDLSPIRLARLCQAEGVEVPYEELVRGIETKENEFVVLTEKDFESARPRRAKTIAMEECVDASEIEPIYFERPFFLKPGEGWERSYALLRNGLKKTGRAGIATFVLKDRMRLGAILPESSYLVLNQLRFADEIVLPRWATPRPSSTAGSGLSLMTRLIDKLTVPFEPHRYQDSYAEQIEALLRGRLRERETTDREAVPEATAPSQIVDLLQKSLDRGRKRAA